MKQCASLFLVHEIFVQSDIATRRWPRCGIPGVLRLKIYPHHLGNKMPVYVRLQFHFSAIFSGTVRIHRRAGFSQTSDIQSLVGTQSCLQAAPSKSGNAFLISCTFCTEIFQEFFFPLKLCSLSLCRNIHFVATDIQHCQLKWVSSGQQKEAFVIKAARPGRITSSTFSSLIRPYHTEPSFSPESSSQLSLTNKQFCSSKVARRSKARIWRLFCFRHKVFRIIPENEDELEFLKNFLDDNHRSVSTELWRLHFL